MYALANPHNFHSMFTPGQLLRAVVLDSASLLILIKHGLLTNPFTQAHMARLRSPNSTVMSGEAWSLSQDGKYLLYKGAVYVPDHQDIRLEVLRSYHDHRLVGHPGIGKTVTNIQRQFYWPCLV